MIRYLEMRPYKHILPTFLLCHFFDLNYELSLLIRFWSCHFVYEILKEKIENTNGVIRIRKSKQDRQRNDLFTRKTKYRGRNGYNSVVYIYCFASHFI